METIKEVNIEMLQKIYLDILLNTPIEEFKYTYNEYRSYQTGIIVRDDIYYKFQIIKEIFLFREYYYVKVEISTSNEFYKGEVIKFDLNLKNHKKEIINLFEKIIYIQEEEKNKNKISNTTKYIPVDYLRKEKLLNIKNTIKK